MATAANDRWWLDGACKAEAEGYQLNSGTPKVIPDPNPNPAKRNPRGIFERNGGLVAMRRVELAEDNLMFRFAAKRYVGVGAEALLPLLNSPWWMEEDRMVLLLDRARTAAVPLVEMARRQLALPDAWTPCDIVVQVRLRPGVLLAAHAGPGLTATGDGGDRRIIAREVPHLFMDQLYVPGLGRGAVPAATGEANARAWFDLATARSYDPAARGFNP